MIAVVLMITIAVLDQITKIAVLLNTRIGYSADVIPGFFNLCHVRNRGAAWGSLSGFRWLLVSISIAVILILYHNRKTFLSMGKTGVIAFGLLLGGIIGNLLDRIRLGYVVDFLDFHFGENHFPAFNVADSAICIGVALIWLISIPKDTAFFRFLKSKHTGKAEKQEL